MGERRKKNLFYTTKFCYSFILDLILTERASEKENSVIWCDWSKKSFFGQERKKTIEIEERIFSLSLSSSSHFQLVFLSHSVSPLLWGQTKKNPLFFLSLFLFSSFSLLLLHLVFWPLRKRRRKKSNNVFFSIPPKKLPFPSKHFPHEDGVFTFFYESLNSSFRSQEIDFPCVCWRSSERIVQPALAFAIEKIHSHKWSQKRRIVFFFFISPFLRHFLRTAAAICMLVLLRRSCFNHISSATHVRSQNGIFFSNSLFSLSLSSFSLLSLFLFPLSFSLLFFSLLSLSSFSLLFE